MNTVLNDLRYALRQLRKSPVFTITAVLTLALGIGANTTMFTVDYESMLAPGPWPHPEQLTQVWETLQGGPRYGSVSTQDFEDWKRLNTTFQTLTAYAGRPFNLATKDQPMFVWGTLATPESNNMMGDKFLYGRDILPEECQAGKDHVVVLVNRLWKRMGSDPNIVGKQIQLDGTSYTVVGVLAPGEQDSQGQSLIVPLVFTPQEMNRVSHWLWVKGRLKPGVTVEQAQANLNAISANIAAAFPETNKGWGAFVESQHAAWSPGGEWARTLWRLLGAVGFVLLIACVNVTNLLLAKGTTRQKEIAIRVSLGATRRQIFAQLLTENLMLALAGGVVGTGLAVAALHILFVSMSGKEIGSDVTLSLNLPVLLFTLAVTMLAGLLFGCAPAWYATRVDLGEMLKQGDRAGVGAGHRRLRNLLVIGEFALALPLLAGAGLEIHSFWNLYHVDLGVTTSHVQTFSLALPDTPPKSSAEITADYQQIISRIESVPGIQDASVASGLPLSGPLRGAPFSIAGQAAFADPSHRPFAAFGSASPDYFRTFGIPVMRGRTFTDQDNAAGMQVAVVNERFVQMFLKGKDPLQQQILVVPPAPDGIKQGPATSWQIVGVFHNVRYGEFRDDNIPEIRVPFGQLPQSYAAIGVRTSGDPALMMRSIAAAVHSVDPQLALIEPLTMEEVKSQNLSFEDLNVNLYIAFALIALLLAAVGLYGVTAFTVAQREHEIGVRITLGARRGDVVSLVLKEALVLAFLGLSLGLVGAYFVGRALQATLYEVGSLDLGAIAAVVLVLLSAALAASFLPARRAASIEPMQALRNE